MNIEIIIPVHNDTKHLDAILTALKNQHLPFEHIVSTTIINDGSDSLTRHLLDKQFHSQANQIIHHPNNQGRSAALNTGSKHNEAEILIMLDADCMPQGSNFLLEHIQSLEKSDISCGKLTANQSHHLFWDKYQQDVVANREQEYSNGNSAVFTTANLAVRKEIFLKVNGFNEKYRHYGFEDRDFLLRCQATGAKMVYTPDAIVSHDSPLSMQLIGNKMQAAGRFTAPIFRQDHPEAYGQMSYARVDLQLNPNLNKLWPLINLLRSVLKPVLVDKLLANELMPYFVKKKLVKFVSALCFMAGTHMAQPACRRG